MLVFSTEGGHKVQPDAKRVVLVNRLLLAQPVTRNQRVGGRLVNWLLVEKEEGQTNAPSVIERESDIGTNDIYWQKFDFHPQPTSYHHHHSVEPNHPPPVHHFLSFISLSE